MPPRSANVPKPRSMKTGMRNVLRPNDSASLWNCTLSPGWTTDESEMLRKAVMKFGIGNWAKIIDSGCLPGKTNAQMNLQLQRLLGQQSTAEFANLHIDPKVIGEKNSKIQGPDIKRKNNTIVNTGGKLSRDALKERVQRNREMYGLGEEIYQNIKLEIKPDNTAAIKKKQAQLKKLKEKLSLVQKKIKMIALTHPERVTKINAQLQRSEAALKLSSKNRRSKSHRPAQSTLPFRSSPLTQSVTSVSPNKKMRLA
ncbi:hypothetical protein BC941DRAFT_474189 [Chlamydoabsidia padenii]|nr:hypothetical protein BC941DRAFT_474189 [Chlamydoabsidia padenii]